jgi:hypothetical protein
MKFGKQPNSLALYESTLWGQSLGKSGEFAAQELAWYIEAGAGGILGSTHW